MNKPMWWAYLHANGSLIVKRFTGDYRDYTDDCEGNDFVQRVIPPFVAESKEEAKQIARERL